MTEQHTYIEKSSIQNTTSNITGRRTQRYRQNKTHADRTITTDATKRNGSDMQ